MSIFRIRIPADGGRGRGIGRGGNIRGEKTGAADVCDSWGICGVSGLGGYVRFRDSANSVAVDVKTAGNVRRGYTDCAGCARRLGTCGLYAGMGCALENARRAGTRCAADMCFGALGCSAGFPVHPNASAFLGCCVRLSLGGVYGGAAFLPIYSKKYTVMKYFKIFSSKLKQPIDI